MCKSPLQKPDRYRSKRDRLQLRMQGGRRDAQVCVRMRECDRDGRGGYSEERRASARDPDWNGHNREDRRGEGREKEATRESREWQPYTTLRSSRRADDDDDDDEAAAEEAAVPAAAAAAGGITCTSVAAL